MVLLATTAPAPSDVVWSNTYLSRPSRMSRAWSITAVILLLTIFWSILLVPVAGLLNVEAISTVWPQLADALDNHPIAKSLVNSGLPTLIVSLLNLAVPYLYYCTFLFSWITRCGNSLTLIQMCPLFKECSLRAMLRCLSFRKTSSSPSSTYSLFSQFSVQHHKLRPISKTSRIELATQFATQGRSHSSWLTPSKTSLPSM